MRIWICGIVRGGLASSTMAAAAAVGSALLPVDVRGRLLVLSPFFDMIASQYFALTRLPAQSAYVLILIVD